MVLQTCHTSKLERFLDSLSEGWMKPHCYFSGGDRGSERPQYTDRENACAVGSHPPTSRGLNRFHGQKKGLAAMLLRLQPFQAAQESFNAG
jgi:hypothetical protein